MGINYYFNREVCESCGRAEEVLHIGKSSAGWCFSLHVDEFAGINSLDDWLELFKEPNSVIENEDGEVLSNSEMQNIICCRKSEETFDKVPYGYKSWEEFHRSNHSEPGPNGLLRHKIDSGFCVGHGSGTWDLLPGEFS